jgi:hypothetical protein
MTMNSTPFFNIVLLLLMLSGFSSCGQNGGGQFTNLSASEFKKLMDEKQEVVVLVRRQVRRSSGHFTGHWERGRHHRIIDNPPPSVGTPTLNGWGKPLLRRGSQNPRCMPRCGLPRKSNRNSIVANDDNYALAA